MKTESLSLMITLEGKEAYEVAKAVCPPRRRLIMADGTPYVYPTDRRSEAVSEPPEGIPLIEGPKDE